MLQIVMDASAPDPGLDGPSDAELVGRATSGDRAAFAAIYDRYGDRIYTTCRHLLRDPDDAADCAGDVFLLAAERLGQLRDPERLRPWLFAIARHEAYRRTRRRSREIPTDTMDDHLDDVPADEPTATDAEDVRRLLADAAEGLDERDRTVLALHLAGGLDGEGLALALGTSVGTAQVAAHRMRERLATSLGALLVARQGRQDCTELGSILAGWDGRFTVLVRKRVARHVKGCEVCDRRRRAVPATLLSAGPALAAPLAIRERVLGDLDLVAHTGRPWSESGFPPADPGARRRRPVGALAAVGAAVVLALLAVVGAGGWGNGDDAVVVADRDRPSPTTSEPTATTTTVATGPSTVPVTVAPPPSTTTIATTTTAAPATTAPTTTRAPSGPRVGVTPTSVDFGSTDGSRTITATNTGDATARVAVVEGLSWLATSTSAADLVPGASAAFTLVVDRAALAEGVTTGTVTVAVEGGASTTVAVGVTAVVAPTITLVRPPSRFAVATPCGVVANVTDPGGVASVRVEYSDQGGGMVSVPMVGPQGTTWSASVTVGGPPRTVTWRVVAVDTAGNVASTPDRTSTVGSTCAS